MASNQPPRDKGKNSPPVSSERDASKSKAKAAASPKAPQRPGTEPPPEPEERTAKKNPASSPARSSEGLQESATPGSSQLPQSLSEQPTASLSPAPPIPGRSLSSGEPGRLLNRFGQSLLSLMLDVPSRLQWNVVFSPISLATSMAALIAGSEGTTRQELCRLLQLELPAVEYIVDRFKMDSAEHMFYVANRMFLQSNCPVLATFRAHVEAKYMTTAQNVDFECPDQSYARAMNEWCSNATNRKVGALVSRKTFAPDTSMVLVSAVFFKGLWKDRFYPRSTKMMSFHVSRTDKLDVRMMTRTGRFPYADVPALRLRALEVPYRAGKLAMVFVLPTDVDGLRLTQQSLLQGDTLWDVLGQLKLRANVRLSLPKFVITGRNKLRSLIEELGITRIFAADQSDFTGISGFKGLHVTELIQAVTLEVSEEGDEIGRTSALVTDLVSKMAPITHFMVDRPFLFFVRSITTGAIVLFGCVRQPLEWRLESPDNTSMQYQDI